MKTFSTLFVAAALLAGGTAGAGDILIRAAQVNTLTSKGRMENADVLVRGGKIAAVGTGIAAPAGATVIEAKGRPLTPGLFGGLSQIGLTEVGLEGSTNDLGIGDTPSSRARWRPELDILLAFNPRSTLLPIARVEGLTWTMLSGVGVGGLLGGQGAAITLDGRYDAEIPGTRTLFVGWGGGSKGAVGGNRAAEFMIFDQMVREVRTPNPNEDTALLYPAGREVIARYLAGGRVVFSVDRAADIHQLLVYAKKLGVKPIILGGAEAWVVAEEIAKAGVPVMLNPLENLPSNFDSLGSRLDNAALLHAAGVRVLIAGGDSHNARKMRQLAGNAVAHGLPWEVGLAALTSAPADVFGVGATRGRIAVGQTADLVLWSGDPLDVTSLADAVWIGGQNMPMESRQRELRDRYIERLKAGRAR